MTMFVSLADLAELHGVKSRKLLSSTAANTDEAVKQAVTSGNMDFYRQVLADWAKSAVLYRHTAATPAEIAKNFAKPDFQAFANELFARVKGEGPVNSAGAGAPPSGGPAIPWQNFEVLDPNTPGTTVPGETFTVTETTPDPVVSSPTQGAPTPPPPAYTPPPASVPALRPEPEPRVPAAPPAPPPTLDIYVMGEVGAPGLKSVAPGTTFLQALSQAGGLGKFAAPKRVQLRRPGTPPQLLVINYDALMDGAAMSVDPQLVEGDVILVPERKLFE